MPEHSGSRDRRQDPTGSAGVHAHGLLPGDSTVPAGTAAALLLGLVGLSGSTVAFAVAVGFAAVLWLLGTADEAAPADDRPARGTPHPPFGPRPPFGPYGWF